MKATITQKEIVEWENILLYNEAKMQWVKRVIRIDYQKCYDKEDDNDIFRFFYISRWG